MRERKGRSLPFVVANEGDAVPHVRDHVGTLATIHADEGNGWDALHAGWDTRRVNHSIAFKDEGVCTNQAESYFSRLRRMEIGTHHHIAGPYLYAYAGEVCMARGYASRGQRFAGYDADWCCDGFGKQPPVGGLLAALRKKGRSTERPFRNYPFRH